jgi:dihydrofolate reductase
MIKLILAIDKGNAIGWSNGELPWKSPSDMAYFKNCTQGSTVLMGNNTFKSLNRPLGLPNRVNAVLSKSARPEIDTSIIVLDSLDQILTLKKTKSDDVWIIGGAQVYTQALDLQIVDELYITQVHVNSCADVVLPFEMYAWKLFVLQQRKLGVNWDLVDIQQPTVQCPSPGVTFLKFKKITQCED